MVAYALTIFLSAFLLFQVQPIIGRFILPWFGGTPAVWTTCMLFFQALLLAGYSYAHFIVARTRVSTQTVIHRALLAASLIFLPMIPSDAWKPTGDEVPTVHILLLLTASIGAPYLLLSATGPLLQSWFASATASRKTYRLYALSNAGSLLALVTYPFLVEPALRLGDQGLIWSAGYFVFALLCGWCAWSTSRAAGSFTDLVNVPTMGEAAIRPRGGVVLTWLALACCASAMLLATTHQMCQEVAVEPFLWVLPLAIYLITFIVAFANERYYRRYVYGVLLAGLAPLAIVVFQHASTVPLKLQLFVYAATLFVCCMICHGELMRSRPNPRYLTLFYLMIAAGGALGGVLVAIVAPLVFHGYWEYYLALSGCCLLLIAAVKRDQLIAVDLTTTLKAWATPAALFGLLLVALGMQAYRNSGQIIEASRNFYGVLRVLEKHDSHGARYSLAHGRIEHGVQFLDPDRRDWPTGYFGKDSGVGLALTEHPKRAADKPLRIGIIGLGAGTLAIYGRPGDTIRYYEINPEVTRLANEHFTFLHDSQAKIEVVHGDGRIGLERELAAGGSNNFDILVVDAFSSDAIPMHLLTRECVELYAKHLAEGGVLAFNISNRVLDLKPVVQSLAAGAGKQAVWIRNHGDPAQGTNDSDWVLVTDSADFLNSSRIVERTTNWPKDMEPVVWTDDYGSLRQVLAR